MKEGIFFVCASLIIKGVSTPTISSGRTINLGRFLLRIFENPVGK